MGRIEYGLKRWGEWFYRTDRLRLDEDEIIVIDSAGWILERPFGKGGRLVLTNKRLVFLSSSVRVIGPRPIDLYLDLLSCSEIDEAPDVGVRARLPTVAKFGITCRGDVFLFQTPDAPDFVLAFRERESAKQAMSMTPDSGAASHSKDP